MTRILILKTAALGDVLRTTSILPGLKKRYRGARIHWLTSDAALDLIRHHPHVDRVHLVDPTSERSLLSADDALTSQTFDRVLSLDDEHALCHLATRISRGRGGVLSGAYLNHAGQPRYTTDVGPWFDMGLLSTFGKPRADELKRENRESHPAIFARMLKIEMGEPLLPLHASARAFADAFASRTELFGHGPVIGLNTGAGDRWEGKRLPEERTVGLIAALSRALEGQVTFLLLGGPEERERNGRILAAARPAARVIDAGVENALLEFASLVARVDVLVTSDSLALHVAISQKVPVVAFFAPTSAAEIELYGRGLKVVSSAPDACSYKKDADTSTLTVERLVEAVLGVLAQRGLLRGQQP